MAATITTSSEGGGSSGNGDSFGKISPRMLCAVTLFFHDSFGHYEQASIFNTPLNKNTSREKQRQVKINFSYFMYYYNYDQKHYNVLLRY